MNLILPDFSKNILLSFLVLFIGLHSATCNKCVAQSSDRLKNIFDKKEINATSSASCSTSGTILREYWNNVPNSTLSDIPFNAPPTGSSQLTIFEGPANWADSYGSRISGYICPPSTGNYTFWIASDNNSELWISTDDNPANKFRCAFVPGYTGSRQWTKYPEQQSAPINLVGSQKYYIEAIHRENTQGDNLAVGWALPGGAIERPIPGSRLSPFTPSLQVNITFPADNSTFISGSNINLAANATGNTGIQKVEFFSNSNKLGEDLSSPYSFSWTNVGSGNYELTALATDNASNTALSSVVNITVIPAAAACTGTGSISREIWNNVPGSLVSDIPIDTPPTSVNQINSFQAPENVADNYGQRLSGFVCPPISGNYIFWIASDNNSELWLSTNNNPANKQKIASVTGWTKSKEWTKYSSQQSVLKSLTAGQQYYIEALHKEGTQGDNLAVGWQLPNSVFERPIPGTRLLPYEVQSTNQLILAGGSWRYLDDGTDQGTTWRSGSFDDSGWKTGNAELGYGDGDEATIVSYGPSSTNKYITTYFRKKFTLSSLSGIAGLELKLLRDDGAVVYINGVEVYRNNLPAGAIDHTTLSSSVIDGTAESQFIVTNINSSPLVTGENQVAVEIHQANVASSDISFNLSLTTLSSVFTYKPNIFAVVGDYGVNTANEASVANLIKSWEPGFIITLGDNNYPDGASGTIDANVGKYYHNYINPYTGGYGAGADTNRFYPSLGNHDQVTPGATPYLQYFTLPGNERYYDFVKGDVHFFVIDSDPAEPDGISSTSLQGTWLKNKLAASLAKWKVVYFHHSPYASDAVHASSAQMQWPFKTWGADIILSAHSHIYERLMKEMPYIVNGLGGHSKYSFSTTPVSGSVIRYNANYGALKVNVSPDTLWFRFYNISNVLIDSFPLIKTGSGRLPACSASIQPGSSTTFCSGGNVTLFAAPGADYTYQWIKDNVNIKGATAASYNISSGGDYQVQISRAGCIAWSAPTRVSLTDNLTAQITSGGPTTFCKGESVMLYGNTCKDYVYQWKKNDVDIPGANSANYLAADEGYYQLKIISGTSIGWSGIVDVIITNCVTSEKPDSLISYTKQVTIDQTKKNDVNEVFKLKVYPNPTTGLFSFDYCIEGMKEEIMEIKVFNTSTGREVYHKPAEMVNGCVRSNIELSGDLPVGLYVLQITIGQKIESTKLTLYR